MSSTKTQLFRLIQRGRHLEKQGLIDGFECYQDWRDEVCQLFQQLESEFGQLVQTPLHVENGIRFLERTFQID